MILRRFTIIDLIILAWLFILLVFVSLIYLLPTTNHTKIFTVSLNSLIKNCDSVATDLNGIMDKPLLTILITGIDIYNINTVINLPSEIALGFSAYSKNLLDILKILNKKEQDLFISLPMEHNNPYHDSGYLALKGSNTKSLDVIMNNYGKYLSGVYTEPGEIFSNYTQEMEKVLSKLNENNLSIYYSGYNPQIENIAKTIGTNFIKPDFIILAEQNENTLESTIAEIKNQIFEEKKDKFFLSMHGSENNIRIFNKLLVDLQKDFIIVPVGAGTK